MPKEKKSTDKLKHFLRGAWYWQKKRDYLSDKILELRSKAEKITTTYQDVPVFGGFDDHRQLVIAKMIDTEKKYEAAVQECTERWNEIDFFIGLLEDYQEKIVMQYRYLYYENWQDIAIKLNYDVRSIYRIHGKALLSLIAIHKRIIEASGKRLF